MKVWYCKIYGIYKIRFIDFYTMIDEDREVYDQYRIRIPMNKKSSNNIRKLFKKAKQKPFMHTIISKFEIPFNAVDLDL